MKTYTIRGAAGDSQILVGAGLAHLPELVAGRQVVAVTDTTVKRLYGGSIPLADVVEIGTGEGVKTLETVCGLYEAFMDRGMDRGCCVVGIGGGIVCDITGFAASTYLRGVDFGFVPTTLLAQVDASMGGKNGVNFGGYKNMVGCFRQPRFVLSDVAFLKTLAPAELACGFAEIIKHALISSSRMFELLEDRHCEALALAPAVLERLVWDSVTIKGGIVNRDEREGDERRKLNFGHTFGHAIEAAAGVPHGHAVSAGMMIAAQMSVDRGLLAPEELARICSLLTAMGLPTLIEVDPRRMADGLLRDKKRARKRIAMVLLEGIGRAVVQPLAIDELLEALPAVLESMRAWG